MNFIWGRDYIKTILFHLFLLLIAVEGNVMLNALVHAGIFISYGVRAKLNF